jgi:hypothetical protein
MAEALSTYIRQRFSPLLFGALVLFLFGFAKGTLKPERSDYFLFPLILALLFQFRLFDDLQNREFDQNKPNRSYTEAIHFSRLKQFLTGFSIALFAVLFLADPIAGAVVTGFFLLNILLYKFLLHQWKFRHILPLLKYPFICLLLVFFFRFGQPVSHKLVAVELALFPAFILYETLTDPTFPLPKFTKALLFAAIFLPFFPAFSLNQAGLVWICGLLAGLLAVLFLRHRALPYLLLLLLLLTRLTLPL